VHGTHTYVGSRHLLPYINPIRQAAQLIEGLEAWFPMWAEQNRAGLVAPQGVVSFVQAGWERTASFVPALCRFRLDLRLSPRTTPEEADQALAAQLRKLATQGAINMEWRRLLSIPGTSTPRDNLVIAKSIEAWETIERRPHEPISGLSGATDANMLRALGIPTARVGLPKAPISDIDFRRGMNTVAIAAMKKLACLLIYTAIAICGVTS
jgi:acetylornithine deacetylase/succinyl-diaminopimelate desuccinylase-like protein